MAELISVIFANKLAGKIQILSISSFLNVFLLPQIQPHKHDYCHISGTIFSVPAPG